MRIFVSYRRDDSRHVAGRIADHLGWEAEVDEVFFDRASIAPGAVFPARLDEAVRRATHTLVVIGRTWSSATLPGADRPRLFDEQDFVRREVTTALAGGGEVIPVLVDGAPMPAADELPPALQALTQRQAFVLHKDGNFIDDIRPLIVHLTGHEPRGGDTLLSIGAKAIGGAVAGLAVFLVLSAVLQYGLGLNAEDLFGGADPGAARERFAMLPWAFALGGALALPLLRRRWRFGRPRAPRAAAGSPG